MRLLHYTAKPFTLDPRRSYGTKGTGCYKPGGLWVSVEGEDDWRNWCESEGWALGNLKHATEIILHPGANVLHIASLSALDAFDREYARPGEYRREIDWKAVMALHDGLIIAPYQYERRFEIGWYYGWDCASGIVWNMSAIESARALDAVYSENS